MRSRFTWWREASPDARRALVAAAFGWMLDSFDVMLWAMVLAALMADLGMTKATAGLLGSLTLAASAAGGLVFGVLADRFGRRKALMASILIYSVFTAACGFATGVAMLAVFRVFLGLGMGGEWASGASLVSETWPARHRGKALGVVQSSWAVGYALAAAGPPSSCPLGAGAPSFSSGSRRPSSPCGSRNGSRSRRSGRPSGRGRRAFGPVSARSSAASGCG